MYGPTLCMNHLLQIPKYDGFCTSTAADVILWSCSDTPWGEGKLLCLVCTFSVSNSLLFSFSPSRILSLLHSTHWSVDSLLIQFVYTLLLLLLLWELWVLLGTHLLLLSVDCPISKRHLSSLCFIITVVWNDDFGSQ